jgi:hypothetical protein
VPLFCGEKGAEGLNFSKALAHPLHMCSSRNGASSETFSLRPPRSSNRSRASYSEQEAGIRTFEESAKGFWRTIEASWVSKA